MYSYHAFGLNFTSEIPLSECLESTSERIDFKVRIAKLTPPTLRKTTIHRRGIMAWTAFEEALWLHWEGVATFKATEGQLLEVHPYTDDADLLSLFTVSEALGLILFQKRLFLLHASALMVGQEAWIFAGEPGAGKSTTCAAFVKVGCPLLSDDLTAIYFDEGHKPYVLPAYPQLKIWEKSVHGLGFRQGDLTAVSEGVNKFALTPRKNFPKKPVPLRRIYLLNKENDASLPRKLKASELTVETLKHFPMPNQFLDAQTLKQYFQQSLYCAQNVDTYAINRFTNFQTLDSWVKQSLAPL